MKTNGRNKSHLGNSKTPSNDCLTNATVSYTNNVIDGVMVIVLASSVVDRRFEPRSVQTMTIKLVFVATHGQLFQ